MNIQKRIVTNANWMVGRSGHSINKIIIHTEVGNNSSSESRFQNPQSQVSVHYGVGFDGNIRQWVEEKDTAYQAGNWAVNLESIGIEHEDFGNYNSPRPDSLYNASSDLVADICRRYGIPCDRAHIFKHSEVIDKAAFPGGTACPDALDIDRIVREANAKLNPAPQPAPSPAPQPTPTTAHSSYERIAKTRYVTNKDANLWDLSASSWADFKPTKILPNGTEFYAVGKAHHPLGGTYLMTEYSFGNADTTGIPAHNTGVNTVDLTEAPLPAPTTSPTQPTTADDKPLPQMQPMPIPTPDDSNNIPVKVIPVDFKLSWNPISNVMECTNDYVIKDLDGKLPDLTLHKGQIVNSAGTFTKNGIVYHRIQKWVDNDQWYGIDGTVLEPHDDPALFHVDANLKNEAQIYFRNLTSRQKINAIAGFVAGLFKRLGVTLHVVKVKN